MRFENLRSLTVGVMCYNESSTLENVVRSAISQISALSIEFEVIIVDDCSTDGSEEISKSLETEYDVVRVIRHTSNQGIGQALRTLYSNAKKDWITIIPSDGEFDPSDLKIGLSHVSEKEKIAVSYTLTQFKPFYRRLISKLQFFINRFFLGVSLERPNWVKILPRPPIQSTEWVSMSPALETEIIAIIQSAGYKFMEIPSRNRITIKKSGGMSKVALLRSVYKSLYDSLLIKKALIRKKAFENKLTRDHLKGTP